MSPAEMARIHAAAFPNRRVWRMEDFQDFLNDPYVTLAATDHGFALGKTVAQEVEILTVAVDPAHQGQGHGRQVVQDLLKFTKTAANAAFLEVSAENGPAMALYLQLGFVEVGRRKGYYATTSGAREDALVLRLGVSQ